MVQRMMNIASNEDAQDELPDVAPVELADDDGDDAVDLQANRAQAAWKALRDRELRAGDQVSDNVVGCWAVYDNSELRFWPGLPVHATRDGAQGDLDELRPTTGHDLVVVEV